MEHEIRKKDENIEQMKQMLKQLEQKKLMRQIPPSTVNQDHGIASAFTSYLTQI